MYQGGRGEVGVSSASWLDRMPPLISLAVVLARTIMLFEADRANVPAFHQSAPISASHSADISQASLSAE